MREQLIIIARKAGAKILEVYEQDFLVNYKDDRSPLTEADRLSHLCIIEGLSAIDPNIPILSEEGMHLTYDERVKWGKFWLVDPLDGTKEFIKRNGEFTVNIALIENNYPIIGVIYVPVTDTLYYGEHGKGAIKIKTDSEAQNITVCRPDNDGVTIVESRSHPSPELESFMQDINQKYSNINRVSKGSSLKFCAIAEGNAHLYPRMGPTMEWDTAAGQAIVEAAGGYVRWLNGDRVHYNKAILRNEFFIVES
ncbi:3'(2'),5'-bisphosphate nucleotidase CysQ [Paenibacillus sp. YIM B09110]|uniref:3'(2'),5'-bisphosphate nucleotidase CysQ n=1 Tax=Paenibacillus sp. YIM B09110 TaxID=3126102 RepID=UPI00301B808F